MKFIRENIYLLLVLLLLTFGCRSCDTVESGKVAQSTIYQDYTIVAGSDFVNVMATFRVGGSGGTTLQLNAPSKIEYNGKVLTENLRTMFAGTNYSFSGSSFESSHQLTYTNGDGRVFQNSLNFDAVELVPGATELSAKEKIVIGLSRSLKDNESIEMTIASLEPTPVPKPQNDNSESVGNKKSTGPSYTKTLTNELNNDKTAVEIHPGDLKDFIPGKAVIRISVQGSGDLQQKTETGGSISYTYTSQNLPVTVVK